MALHHQHLNKPRPKGCVFAAHTMCCNNNCVHEPQPSWPALGYAIFQIHTKRSSGCCVSTARTHTSHTQPCCTVVSLLSLQCTSSLSTDLSAAAALVAGLSTDQKGPGQLLQNLTTSCRTQMLSHNGWREVTLFAPHTHTHTQLPSSLVEVREACLLQGERRQHGKQTTAGVCVSLRV